MKSIFLLLFLFPATLFSQVQHFVDFYENKQKRSEGDYVRGLEHGNWKFWYDSGKLQEEASYYMGQFNGPVIRYYPNGQLQHEGYFKLDRQDSLMRSFTADGKLLEEGLYIKDQKFGKWSFILYWIPFYCSCFYFEDLL